MENGIIRTNKMLPNGFETRDNDVTCPYFMRPFFVASVIFRKRIPIYGQGSRYVDFVKEQCKE